MCIVLGLDARFATLQAPVAPILLVLVGLLAIYALVRFFSGIAFAVRAIKALVENAGFARRVMYPTKSGRAAGYRSHKRH